MSVPADITYPKAATRAAWDKGKTLLDKASSKTKKTGLGEALAEAQEAWGKIPFKTLVAANVKVTNSAEARRALEAANAAIKTEVAKANTAVGKARKLAASLAVNKNLSKDSQKAALAAELALKALEKRIGSFGTDDFQKLIESEQAKENKAYAALQGQLTELVFKDKTGKVATATAGVWNRRELKADGINWTKGRGTDYIGKTLTVEARQLADDHKVDQLSGQTNSPQAKFINDLKVEAVSGRKAILKP